MALVDATTQPGPGWKARVYAYTNMNHPYLHECVELWYLPHPTTGDHYPHGRCTKVVYVCEGAIDDILVNTSTRPHGKWTDLRVPTPGIRMDFDYDGRDEFMRRYRKSTTVWSMSRDAEDYAPGRLKGDDYSGNVIYLDPVTEFDYLDQPLEWSSGEAPFFPVRARAQGSLCPSKLSYWTRCWWPRRKTSSAICLKKFKLCFS